jgi:hypothetical protein
MESGCWLVLSDCYAADLLERLTTRQLKSRSPSFCRRSPLRTADTARSSVTSIDRFDFAKLLSQTRAKSWAIHNDNGHAQWDGSDDQPAMPPPLHRREMQAGISFFESDLQRSGPANRGLNEDWTTREHAFGPETFDELNEEKFKRADSAPPLSPVLRAQVRPSTHSELV